MSTPDRPSRFPDDGTPQPDHTDASFWWLDDSAASTSRPSELRMNLERLRRDVHEAPDLSARILGQAGRQEAFVPRGRRNALRAMRWGAAAAAALVLGATLFIVYRTPAGAAVMPEQATPVSDLVADLSVDAERVADNVRALPTRVVFANSAPQPRDAGVAGEAQPPASEGTTMTLAAAFSADEPAPIVAVLTPSERRASATPLGVGSVLDALDQIARMIEAMPPRVLAQTPAEAPSTLNATINDLPAPGLHLQRAGFFAGEPDPR